MSSEMKKSWIVSLSSDATVDRVSENLRKVFLRYNLPSKEVKEITRREILNPPPFTVLYAIVELFVYLKLVPRALCADLNERDGEEVHVWCRTSKLRYITRVLNFIALANDKPIDVLVSPAKVLAGEDLQATLFLLTALSRVEQTFAATSGKITDSILAVGDEILYKKNVMTRKEFTRFQACFRGWRCRRRMNNENFIEEVNQRLSPIREDCLSEIKSSNSSVDRDSESEVSSRKDRPLVSITVIQDEHDIISLISEIDDNNDDGYVSTKNCSEGVAIDKSSRDDNELNVELLRLKTLSLERKFNQKLRKLKEKENELKLKEQKIEKKENRVSKLASNLRRQSLRFNSERKKKEDEEKETVAQNQIMTKGQQQQNSDVIVQSLLKEKKRMEHIQSLEMNLRCKEEELANKEERIAKTSENLRKQQVRLVDKERKLEILEKSFRLISLPQEKEDQDKRKKSPAIEVKEVKDNVIRKLTKAPSRNVKEDKPSKDKRKTYKKGSKKRISNLKTLPTKTISTNLDGRGGRELNTFNNADIDLKEDFNTEDENSKKESLQQTKRDEGQSQYSCNESTSTVGSTVDLWLSSKAEDDSNEVSGDNTFKSSSKALEKDTKLNETSKIPKRKVSGELSVKNQRKLSLPVLSSRKPSIVCVPENETLTAVRREGRRKSNIVTRKEESMLTNMATDGKFVTTKTQAAIMYHGYRFSFEEKVSNEETGGRPSCKVEKNLLTIAGDASSCSGDFFLSNFDKRMHKAVKKSNCN